MAWADAVPSRLVLAAAPSLSPAPAAAVLADVLDKGTGPCAAAVAVPAAAAAAVATAIAGFAEAVVTGLRPPEGMPLIAAPLSAGAGAGAGGASTGMDGAAAAEQAPDSSSSSDSCSDTCKTGGGGGACAGQELCKQVLWLIERRGHL